METTFKRGDFVIDLNGQISKIKSIFYVTCVVEGDVYYANHEIPVTYIRHATEEEIAAWIAKKMLN